ncbi:MAG: hypothetical protein P8Z37_06310 [Acidobacteriota bacterium]
MADKTQANSRCEYHDTANPVNDFQCCTKLASNPISINPGDSTPLTIRMAFLMETL